jgi:hypothetical protein
MVRLPQPNITKIAGENTTLLCSAQEAASPSAVALASALRPTEGCGEGKGARGGSPLTSLSGGPSRGSLRGQSTTSKVDRNCQVTGTRAAFAPEILRNRSLLLSRSASRENTHPQISLRSPKKEPPEEFGHRRCVIRKNAPGRLPALLAAGKSALVGPGSICYGSAPLGLGRPSCGVCGAGGPSSP